MKILVTGITGFTGHHLLARLAARHAVTALVRRAPAASLEGVEYLTVDLSKPLSIQDLPREMDAVLHMATSPYHREFPEKASDLFAVNVASTAALLDYARDVGCESFVQLSTGSVYEPFVMTPLAEGVDGRPLDFYAATKLVSETLARPYSSIMRILSIRLFNPYGPGQSDRFVPNLLSRIAAGEPVLLPEEGDGMTISPCYVDDVCDTVAQSLEAPWDGELNLAGPESLTLTEVAATIGRALHKQITFERRPGIPVKNLVPDLSLLSRLVEVEGFVRFEEGLRRTIAAQSADD